MSIAQSLIVEVAAALPPDRTPSDVRVVHLDIGELSGIEPDALSFAFECLSPESPLYLTRLSIHRIPCRWLCSACGKAQTPEHIGAPCPGCGGAKGRLEGGMELLIRRIEVV